MNSFNYRFFFAGLRLILNLKQDEYVPVLSQGAGARIVIHDQDRMPFPSDEGILTTPGHVTSVGVRQVRVSRESEPYSNCTHVTEANYTRNVYEELYPVKYSTSVRKSR